MQAGRGRDAGIADPNGIDQLVLVTKPTIWDAGIGP